MDRMVAAMPSWERRFSNKYLIKTVKRMNALADASGLSRREIAERAGWKEPYLSRVLSGQQNLTLRSLAKLEDAIGADVLAVTGDDDAAVAPGRLSSEASPLESFATYPEHGEHFYVAANDYAGALRYDDAS